MTTAVVLPQEADAPPVKERRRHGARPLAGPPDFHPGEPSDSWAPALTVGHRPNPFRNEASDEAGAVHGPSASVLAPVDRLGPFADKRCRCWDDEATVGHPAGAVGGKRLIFARGGSAGPRSGAARRSRTASLANLAGRSSTAAPLTRKSMTAFGHVVATVRAACEVARGKAR
jgi:hypothetical protein